MKKHYPIFLGILFFFPSVFQAKTLVVREYGRGTPYSNLQQAHNAATDGDTIAVDAAADGTWEEGTPVTISKQVYLTTLQSRKLKLINGLEVKLLNNRKLTVTDLDSTSISISGTGELTIANCVIISTVYCPNSVRLKLFKCKIESKIYTCHLVAFGNTFRAEVVIDSFYNAVDSILMIGNVLEKLVVFNTFKTVIFSNNYIKSNFCSYYSYSCDDAGTGVIVKNVNSDNSLIGRSIISNNTIYHKNVTAFGSILRVDNNLLNKKGKLLIYSNSFFADISGSTGIFVICGNVPGGGNSPSFLDFAQEGNISCNNFIAMRRHGTWTPQPTASKNYYGNSIPAIDSLGRLSGPEFTDKGLDLPEFSDIDLTRNDIGTEGGPWPISNFWGPNASKAWVGWLDLPLKISTPSTPIQIKATGINKD